MRKKKPLYILTCLLGMLCLLAAISCGGDSSKDSPTDDPLTTAAIRLLAGQYATISYDVSADVLNKKSNSKNKASASEPNEISGTADFTGEITSELRKGLIRFDNFTSRTGFPTIQSGEFNVDLNVTDTTVQGTISADDIEMNDQSVAFNVSYDLYLENELWRGTMTGTVTINDMTASIRYDYDTPILSKLEAVPLDAAGNETTGIIKNGGKVKIKIGVNSNAPVNVLNTNWNSPEQNLEGGGGTQPFDNVSNGYWEYEKIYTISAFQPSGEYTWEFSVGNAAMLTSASQSVSMQVQNDQAAEKPVILEASIETSELSSGNGGTATLTLSAESIAPLNYLTYELDGPLGSIEGGGGTAAFEKVDETHYTYSKTWTFSKWDANGTYTLRKLTVSSEADLSSEPYADLSFVISNNQEADMPVITKIELHKCISEDGSCAEYEADDINQSTISAADFEGKNLELVLVITATSNAPINWVDSAFEGPTTNLQGGGGWNPFTQISENTWQLAYYHKIDSPYYAPKGKYYWHKISVGNEGRKYSDTWTGELYFNLTE